MDQALPALERERLEATPHVGIEFKNPFQYTVEKEHLVEVAAKYPRSHLGTKCLFLVHECTSPV
jgi:hypothetical protein